jgi:SAM-dependent methyltransferase
MTYSYTDLLAIFGIGGAHPGGLPLTRAIFEELNIRKETVFLEVGCGTGQTTAHIKSKYDCQLYAIDNHPTMIRKAEKRLQSLDLHATIMKANAENLPFPDHLFDFVLSESVTAFTNISQSLPEYFRVLNDEGTLLLIEMTEIDNLGQNEEKELKHFYHLNEILSESEWMDAIKKSGFQTVDSLSIALDELLIQDTDFTEFDVSENIDATLFDLLDLHEGLTEKYKDKVGFRVFLCKKN